MNNKIRVICDTVIWYEIAKGKIDISNYNNYYFTATGVNIFELSKTSNLINNFNLYKNTLQALANFHDEIIEYYPLEFILVYSSKINFKYDRQSLLETLVEFSFLLSCDFKESDVVDNRKEKFIQTVKELNKPIDKFINDLNDYFSVAKENLKKSKKDIRELNKHKTKDIFINFMSLWFGDKVKMTKSDFNWTNIELISIVLREFFLENLLQRNKKIEYNDLFDLLNLAYVRKGDKYWTKEKRWSRLIKLDEKVEHYLFTG